MTYLNDELYLSLSFDEKIKYANKIHIPSEVGEYLTNCFKNLTISVPIYNQERKIDNILNLMFDGLLEGWCFETTESAIVFLNDYDYIERGYIYINEDNPHYYHSWINFKYNNCEYVLDASLNFLCTKEIYFKLFNPKVEGLVSSLMVREEIMKQFEKRMIITDEKYCNFIKENDPFFYYNRFKRNKDSIFIKPENDVNKPIYRNKSKYRLKTDNNKIKKLEATYYFSN